MFETDTNDLCVFRGPCERLVVSKPRQTPYETRNERLIKTATNAYVLKRLALNACTAGRKKSLHVVGVVGQIIGQLAVDDCDREIPLTTAVPSPGAASTAILDFYIG